MMNIKQMIFWICAIYYPLQANAEVVVIVNPANTENISAKDIENIYLGKSTSFSSGKKAVPFRLKSNNSVHDEFVGNVLNKNSSQFASIWSRLLFSGRSKPPKELSEAETIQRVSSNPSAIGYVDASLVTPDVKVIYRK